MSFEMKYDKDGMPIKQEVPIIDEQPEESNIEQENLPDASYESQNTSPKENDVERNFRQLREKTERIQRERDEALRVLQEVQAKSNNLESNYEDIRISPDELVEGKHLSRYENKIKKLEEQINRYHTQSVELATEARLKAQYPDFDRVVSAEHIAKLRETYPEIAATLHSAADLYSKAVSTYTIIKNLGIAQDQSYGIDKERAQRNAGKPRPLSSIGPQQGDTPLSRVNAFTNGLTEDVRKALHKEMMESIKNR